MSIINSQQTQMQQPQQQQQQNPFMGLLQALIPFGMMAGGIPPQWASLAGTLMGGKGGMGNIFNPMAGAQGQGSMPMPVGIAQGNQQGGQSSQQYQNPLNMGPSSSTMAPPQPPQVPGQQQSQGQQMTPQMGGMPQQQGQQNQGMVSPQQMGNPNTMIPPWMQVPGLGW